MRVGVAIEEAWDFFHEVYADLTEHHDAVLFSRRSIKLPALDGRLNNHLFRRDMKAFLRSSDVAFFEWASGLLAAATHLPKSCPIITRLHRYEMYQWADKINWEAVDRIILVSNAKHREFVSRFAEHAAKTVVIPEAVSLNRFRPNGKRFAGDIGILCHMKPRKRVYELVLTFHELLQRHPDFHLHIGGGRAAGFSDYYDVVRDLVRNLGLEGKVTFYGHVDRPEDWYQLIDIYVSNGYSEGLQVSALEAMASGCYCISHNWEGAEELLPRHNLFYTSSQLQDLILQYTSMPAASQNSLRNAMRSRVFEQFNVDNTKVRIRKLVEQAGGCK